MTFWADLGAAFYGIAVGPRRENFAPTPGKLAGWLAGLAGQPRWRSTWSQETRALEDKRVGQLGGALSGCILGNFFGRIFEPLFGHFLDRIWNQFWGTFWADFWTEFWLLFLKIVGPIFDDFLDRVWN